MKTFERKWIEYTLIPCDNYWAYCVGIVEDVDSGKRFVRVARGKVTGEKSNPIIQINRLNIRHKWEWKEIRRLTDEFLKRL